MVPIRKEAPSTSPDPIQVVVGHSEGSNARTYETTASKRGDSSLSATKPLLWGVFVAASKAGLKSHTSRWRQAGSLKLEILNLLLPAYTWDG